jgi:hypothetical protein
MQRPLLLVAFALAAAASLVACQPPDVILLAQASSNPLWQKRAFGVMPVDDADGGLETRYFAMRAKGDAPPPESTSPISTDFLDALFLRAGERGIRVVGMMPSVRAQFLVWPRLTLQEAGTGAGAEVRMRVRITTAEGALVDEIAVRHLGRSDDASPAAERIRELVKANAATVADYLARRALGSAAAAPDPATAGDRNKAAPTPAPPASATLLIAP